MDIEFPITEDFESDMKNTFRLAEELKFESDRGVVLVVAAFLDEQLELLLTRHFIDDTKVVSELLSNSGPLGSFSSRIKVAYCLDLIRPEHYSDLQIVRKIRNEFAHSHTPVSFDSSRVRDFCMNFKHLNGLSIERKAILLSSFSFLFETLETTRNQFIFNTMNLFFGLTMRINMSTTGVIDATRFIERDVKHTEGMHFRKLVDELET
jgi:DNA-binding MltR family transcriptional regulator